MTLDWSQFCELVEGDDGKSVSEPLPPLNKIMVNMENINMVNINMVNINMVNINIVNISMFSIKKVNINTVNMDKVKVKKHNINKSFASPLPGGWMSFCDEDIDDLKCQDSGELLLGHTCLTRRIVVRIFVFFCSLCLTIRMMRVKVITRMAVRIFVFFNIFQFLLLMPDY